jgi:hypothetical protein
MRKYTSIHLTPLMESPQELVRASMEGSAMKVNICRDTKSFAIPSHMELDPSFLQGLSIFLVTN